MKKLSLFFIAFLMLFSANVFAVDYDLYVAGVQITDVNKDNITAAVVAAEHSASGTITFDPASNTLTLEDANFSTSAIGIENSIANLTINLVGGNSLSSTIEDAMKLNASTKITGSGTLTATSPKSAIWHREDTLTIENTDVTLNGGNAGIDGRSKTLNINNSTVRATGTNNGSIYNINSLILNGCFISQPAGAEFNAEQKAVCLNGEIVKTEVVIEPATTYTVSGTVLDNENNPLAGVTITYNGGTTTTAADGTYSFTTIENTTYTVTPSKIGCSFEPASLTVNVVDADVTGIDFVGTEGEIYDLYVAGVQITDVNKDNITAAVVAAGHTASGTITYDTTTNTLTLDNATINATVALDGIENQIANLTINLIGENTINTEYRGIYSNANFIITGNGSLTINAHNIGIYHGLCNLTIENTTITAIGNLSGICGYNGNYEVLSITNSTVRATGTNWGSIGNIKSLVLNGCFISQPAGAVFVVSPYSIKGVYYNGGLVKTEVVIEPGIAPTYYDLYVAGVQITDANKDDISAAVVDAGHSASGTITFDPASNTLTLEDANFSTSTIGIENSIANLTINLVGGNSLTSPIEDAMKLNASTKITGSGTLTATSPKSAIWHREDTLTIENTDVTLNGGNAGIDGRSKTLNINNSTVRATGTNNGSIYNINSLVLNGCFISQPVGAEFNAEQKAVCLNGEIVKEEVVIEPTIPVAIEESINENIIFQVNGKELTIVNTENLPIRIYNLVGQEIAYKENSNNQESFDLPQTGVYIVKIGNKTEKIFIK